MSDIGRYLEYNNSAEIYGVSSVVQNLFSNRARTGNQNFLQLMAS